tara:strand:- start:586 stop:873 length:288 start_codon:yes stop_codon:yes gene_type:complete
MTKAKPIFRQVDAHKYSKLGVRRKKKVKYRFPNGRDNKIIPKFSFAHKKHGEKPTPRDFLEGRYSGSCNEHVLMSETQTLGYGFVVVAYQVYTLK